MSYLSFIINCVTMKTFLCINSSRGAWIEVRQATVIWQLRNRVLYKSLRRMLTFQSSWRSIVQIARGDWAACVQKATFSYCCLLSRPSDGYAVVLKERSWLWEGLLTVNFHVSLSCFPKHRNRQSISQARVVRFEVSSVKSERFRYFIPRSQTR